MGSVRPKFPSVSNINGLAVVTDGTLPLLCPAQGFPVPNHRYVPSRTESFFLSKIAGVKLPPPFLFLCDRDFRSSYFEIPIGSKESSFIFNPFVTKVALHKLTVYYDRFAWDTIRCVLYCTTSDLLYIFLWKFCFYRVCFSRDSAHDLSRAPCTFLPRRRKKRVKKSRCLLFAFQFRKSAVEASEMARAERERCILAESAKSGSKRFWKFGRRRWGNDIILILDLRNKVLNLKKEICTHNIKGCQNSRKK